MAQISLKEILKIGRVQYASVSGQDPGVRMHGERYGGRYLVSPSDVRFTMDRSDFYPDRPIESLSVDGQEIEVSGNGFRYSIDKEGFKPIIIHARTKKWRK